MDWFLYDNELCHERVNGFFWSFSKRKISQSNKQYNEPVVNNEHNFHSLENFQ